MPLERLDQIWRRGHGNPLFTEALLQSDGDEIPYDLRELLSTRVTAPPEPTRSLLRVAAAAGTTVRPAVLVELTGLLPSEVHAGMRPAVERQVVRCDGTAYEFRHELYREVVYAELLPGERQQLHAGLATTLTADPGESALHWHRAGNREQACASAVRAGLAAKAVHAYAEAADPSHGPPNSGTPVPRSCRCPRCWPRPRRRRTRSATANGP